MISKRKQICQNLENSQYSLNTTPPENNDKKRYKSHKPSQSLKNSDLNFDTPQNIDSVVANDKQLNLVSDMVNNSGMSQEFWEPDCSYPDTRSAERLSKTTTFENEDTTDTRQIGVKHFKQTLKIPKLNIARIGEQGCKDKQSRNNNTMKFAKKVLKSLSSGSHSRSKSKQIADLTKGMRICL